MLDGVDLGVAPGDHVAITGPSGGGKSTLVKILLGLLEPDGGELLVDGVPLARFGHKNYHGQIAAVLQDDHLFAGSLADNIALFDDAPDMERIAAGADAAAIHDDIVRMPMGYETLVGDMGSTLSGGQKQRVLLARALYREPRVLVDGRRHLAPRPANRRYRSAGRSAGSGSPGSSSPTASRPFARPSASTMLKSGRLFDAPPRAIGTRESFPAGAVPDAAQDLAGQER